MNTSDLALSISPATASAQPPRGLKQGTTVTGFMIEAQEGTRREETARKISATNGLDALITPLSTFQYVDWCRRSEAHVLCFPKGPAPSWLPHAPCSIPPAAQRARGGEGNLFVPAVGIEPTWSCPRRILSPLRLPVPPRRHRENLHEPFRGVKKKDQRHSRRGRAFAA